MSNPLDLARTTSLLRELQSAKNLLRDGTLAIRRMQTDSEDVDAVFALTSLGVEKMLKISLGLMHLDESGVWPSLKGRGHRVAAMNDELTERLRRRASPGGSRLQPEKLLDQCDADPHWSKMLTALDRYGREGRFAHLDHLASGVLNADVTPKHLWDEIARGITLENSAVLKGLPSVGAYRDGRLELNSVIERSTRRWWEMLHSHYTFGLLGSYAQSLGSEIAPVG